VQAKGLLEYTVVFPVYFHVRSENTARLHVWPLFGVQTFDDGAVVEYSTLYPFFRFTTFSRSPLEDELYVRDTPHLSSSSSKRMVTSVDGATSAINQTLRAGKGV
jgi:hypothetical protein